MIETPSSNELWDSNVPEALFRIAANGQTDYRIVAPAEPTSTERIAAAELAKYLELISGATFEVVDDTSPDTDAEIVLGFGRRTDALLPGYDLAELGHDGFIIKTVGTRLIIAGGKKRGAMYAVYSFLEDTLGCRWWTPAEELVPDKAVIDILPIDRKDIPTFISRDTLCISNREGGNNWPIKHKLNGTGSAVTAEEGGKVRIYPGGHSFSALIDPKEHFDEHPEWFAMIDGQRQPYQLCTSNEEVVLKCIETVKGLMGIGLWSRSASVGLASASRLMKSPCCERPMVRPRGARALGFKKTRKLASIDSPSKTLQLQHRTVLLCRSEPVVDRDG